MPDGDVIAALTNVTKKYGAATAVDDLTLRIERGEFISILGPSGCGKTTTLSMLGGFVQPDVGTIELAGKDITDTPPYRRDVNTVFQSYALFAHLDVFGNVAFGLRRRRVPRRDIERRVGEMLALVGLADRRQARPGELSGGQQQRVALARALVNMPSVLLLDEPLGALDLKLRREMQQELKLIQREVGVTFVFVTHDQEEAMSMSDRIAVMNSGRLQQLGRPREIYDRPANAFVAGFIGASNLMRGTITSAGLELDGGVALLPSNGLALPIGTAVIASIRPEKLTIASTSSGLDPHLDVEIVDAVYLGAVTQVSLRIGSGARLTAIVPHGTGMGDALAVGMRAVAEWRPDDMLVLAAAGGSDPNDSLDGRARPQPGRTAE
jgi:spermidine/putrescine transport system ATP-binding protein